MRILRNLMICHVRLTVVVVFCRRRLLSPSSFLFSQRNRRSGGAIRALRRNRLGGDGDGDISDGKRTRSSQKRSVCQCFVSSSLALPSSSQPTRHAVRVMAKHRKAVPSRRFIRASSNTLSILLRNLRGNDTVGLASFVTANSL